MEKKTVSAKLISTIIEYISGIEVFKSFGVIGDKFERLEKGFRDLKIFYKIRTYCCSLCFTFSSNY